jgi:hypothetical protein
MHTFAPRAKALRFVHFMAAVMSLVPALATAVEPGRTTTARPPVPSSASRPMSAAEIQRQHEKLRADLERKRADNLRRTGQMKQPSQTQFDRTHQKNLAEFDKLKAATAAKAAPPSPPFSGASAPPPAECLTKFFAAARNASSMDPLLAYLPLDEQKSLKERQAQYNPKEAAASRQYWKKKDPNMSEHSVTFMTNSPYANALDHYRTLANKFIDVLSVKTEGNKATIVVSTRSGATSGGEHYPYGKATIELVGEGNTWHFSTYNDSNWSYKELPTAP